MMTTMNRAMPVAARVAAIGRDLFSAAQRNAALALVPRGRRYRVLHDLDDWILNDIGLEREDVMSPEARRTMTRLSVRSLW